MFAQIRSRGLCELKGNDMQGPRRGQCGLTFETYAFSVSTRLHAALPLLLQRSRDSGCLLHGISSSSHASGLRDLLVGARA